MKHRNRGGCDAFNPSRSALNLAHVLSAPPRMRPSSKSTIRAGGEVPDKPTTAAGRVPNGDSACASAAPPTEAIQVAESERRFVSNRLGQ
jgi:hypothetical protein